ncbi:MAG: phytoene/squalene synthase family protein [Alphaproteobacteria bacterium]
MEPGLEGAVAHCATELRRHDRDRYLVSLFAPDPERRALFALYAFNLEISKIRESVSEPMLGEIRLQWWRDALDGIKAGAPRQHTVVLALSAAVGRHDLSIDRMGRIIDSRAFDLEDRQPANLEELTAYAGDSSGELACLALEVLGVRDPPAMAAGHAVGVAWALVGLIRAVPFHATQRRCYLPESVTAEAGLHMGALYEGAPGAALVPVVAEIARAAADALDRAEAALPTVPRAGHPALLGRHLTRMDLRRLARAGYDPFSLKPAGPLRGQLRLMLGNWGLAR